MLPEKFYLKDETPWVDHGVIAIKYATLMPLNTLISIAIPPLSAFKESIDVENTLARIIEAQITVAVSNYYSQSHKTIPEGISIDPYSNIKLKHGIKI